VTLDDDARWIAWWDKKLAARQTELEAARAGHSEARQWWHGERAKPPAKVDVERALAAERKED
jgi:hypothetical protein